MARLHPWIAALVAIAFGLIVAHGRHTPYNNFVLQSQAWLQGREAIAWPGAYIDALPYNGAYYVIEAPLPALLLLPLVALGIDANQTTLAVLLAGAAVGFTWSFGQRIGLGIQTNAWLAAAFFLGTDLLWCAMLGDVWMIAHVAACACTMAVIAELVGKRRGWIIGLASVAAVFSRFSSVLAIPLAALLVRRARIGFAVCIALGAVLWVAHNEGRWGLPYDIGYTAWYHQDSAGSPIGSPFQLRYLGYELWSFFVQTPHWQAGAPYLIPSLSGVALTWTSPWMIFALFARAPRDLVLNFAVAALAIFAVNAVYYVNGYAQFGMRHALDFAPYLTALVGFWAAARGGFPWWAKATIAWSSVVGLWGVWYWNVFVRATS